MFALGSLITTEKYQYCFPLSKAISFCTKPVSSFITCHASSRKLRYSNQIISK